MKTGILSIQGSVVEHSNILKQLGVNFILVRSLEDLKPITHLIIPGGESTTLTKLLKVYGLWDELKKRAEDKTIKIFGTCAGAILCEHFGLNAKINRNAYGAQLNSFSANLESKQFPDLKGVFIRAPRFESVGDNVTILARHEDEPVLIEQDNFLACAFHPELADEIRIHEYFLSSKL
jgi:5'-phosphate synthase pdxT subunit